MIAFSDKDAAALSQFAYIEPPKILIDGANQTYEQYLAKDPSHLWVF